MTPSVDPERIQRAYVTTRAALLAERTPSGHWAGELSNSALSTATALMALEMILRNSPGARSDADVLRARIDGGVAWLLAHQNADGGWGDTVCSLSNISTTMLCHATLHATCSSPTAQEAKTSAAGYIERAGGVPALRARYGKDKTFSIPILTHCALAGLVDWRDVAALPFELACLPAEFYKWVKLPVVSYALPALIAIGQVRHHFVRPWSPVARIVRKGAIPASLRVLERIQPAGGGFLEATPLTSFVTMSLAGMGRVDHPVARNGLEFILRSVHPDGSWPIDSNLATWVTTLSVNALGPDLPEDAIDPLRTWLLAQQYRDVHLYTNADPGGWAWTDLPGGVPDADDTPGAILALLGLSGRSADFPTAELKNAVGWLLDLQNRDGGWPTFCRGWGALPFDRSAADITAHALRALERWHSVAAPIEGTSRGAKLIKRSRAAVLRGFRYLADCQRPDGSWLPLWFGNQYVPGDENPVYGTARVLAAFRDSKRIASPEAKRGVGWLCEVQNGDGGWGGTAGVGSSVEESALAAEFLLSVESNPSLPSPTCARALAWLVDRVEAGTWTEPSPIGFYFAKLWYFEKLYPMIFTVGALRAAMRLVGQR